MCRGIHAEQNAIIQSANYGTGIRGATVYTTQHPCSVCAKMIINAGLVRVVTDDSYPDDLASDMLTEAGIRVDRLPDIDPVGDGSDPASSDDVAAASAYGGRDPETGTG